jgi:hypothetical protein
LLERCHVLLAVRKALSMNNVTTLAADASRLAALLVGHMRPACSLLAPGDPGASPPILGHVIH